MIGLKENVLIGKLIPAGTGMRRYRATRLNTDTNPEMEEVLVEDEEEIMLDEENVSVESEETVISEDAVIGVVEE